MNDDWNCSICTQVLYKPCSLPCGHSYCATCLSQVVDKKCPQCRTPFRDIPAPNIVLINLLQKHKPNEYTERAAFESSSVSDWVAHRRQTLSGFKDVQWSRGMHETMVKRILRELDRVEAWNDGCKNLTKAVGDSPSLGPRWVAVCGESYTVYSPGQCNSITLIWETFLVTLVNVGTVIESPPVPVPTPPTPVTNFASDSLDRFVYHQMQRAPEVEALRRAVREDGMSRPQISIAWPTPPSVPMPFTFGGVQPLFNVQPRDRDTSWDARPAVIGAQDFPL